MTENRNIARTIIVFLVRALVCIILLAVGIGIFSALYTTRPLVARSDLGDRAPRVMVMEAGPVEVFRQWDGFGTARAIDSADVPARVTATVLGIPEGVTVGRTVAAGDLLARLDDSDFTRQEEITTHSIGDIDAQLERIAVERESWTERVDLAGQQVVLARAEFDRATEAQERGSARPREVDVAKQGLISAIRDETVAREEYDKLMPRRRSLQAQRLSLLSQGKLAAENVARCRITSPIRGVLQEVDIEVGESLMAGQRVARVVDRDRIEVPVRLASSARASVRVGDVVRLKHTGSAQREWESRVSRIAPEDDESTRTMSVFAEVRQDARGEDDSAVDPVAGLAPGQFLRGVVTSSDAQLRWIIPRRAINHDRVLLVDDGRIVSRGVDVDYQVEASFPQFGVPDREWVVLRDPLGTGALVVITPKRSLADGLTVQPVLVGESAQAAGGPGPGTDAGATDGAAGGESLR